jgi:MFS transporter, putative metabolite:H+ symporter
LHNHSVVALAPAASTYFWEQIRTVPRRTSRTNADSRAKTTWLGAGSATEVLILATAAYAVLQTIAFSLYLYSAELYPTRLRAVGTGFGSAWLRAGSSIGPILVGTIVADLGIQYVFAAFAAVAIIGGLVTLLFAIETKGRVLEDLSP